MINGLFVNTPKNFCSIYEAGVMVKNALLNSDKYNLDYIETDQNFNTQGYDFYIINWHHLALPIPHSTIKNLSGLKIGMVLETSENTIFEITPDIFDAYMAIDPTVKRTSNIFPFPRPLETVDNLRLLLREDIPVIGSFGLYTSGKRYEEIIEYYNNTKKEAIIRINIPYGTYTYTRIDQIQAYGEYLKSLAKSNVQVIFTTEYKSKPELVRWLSEHSINIFMYYRSQPGLAATVDQSISSGRAIAITNNPTFRHLLQYIDYYPHQTFEQLTTSTLPGIKQMQIDWSKEKFQEKFIELLTEKGLL
jgi:hypothetical protein